MAENDQPIIHTCSACGALIDISDEEPLALVHCPSCGTGQRVRTNFHHFQIQDVMGAGGMGAVYRAYDTNLNRYVALKLLRKEFCADPEFVAQFKREAATTASINHPHVVKVFSAGEDHGHVYIAMELVDKGSLDDLMNLQGKVAEAQVLLVGSQIAQGLAAALGRGLIHRDVKPGNILFADANASKIVDFGLATLQEHANTQVGDVWGTPYYVAPEKLDVPPAEDFRSDMYSLGATLFHALAGRPPFEAETASMVALKHLKSQVVSLQAFAPDVSSATAFVINKTLHKDPAQRYQSYQELVEHLDYARAELLKTGGVAKKRARVVLEDDGDAKAMSWITFGMVGVIVLGGLGAWLMRDKLFGSKEVKPDPAIEQREVVEANFQDEFKKHREMLLTSDFKRAAAGFAEMGENAEVPQPIKSWATLHEGLALLLDGKEEQSRPIFKKLGERGLFGREPNERKLAQFFIDLGKAMSSEEALPASAAKDLNKSDHESIALLLYALKDWQLKQYGEAGPLFRQFQSATPGEPLQWIADYKQFTAQYVDDFAVFRSAESAASSHGGDLKKMRTALATLKSVRGQLKMPGELPARVDSMVEKLDKAVTEMTEAEDKINAEMEAGDAASFADLRKRSSPYIPHFRLEEGKAVFDSASFLSEKYKAARKAQLEKFDALMAFKEQLIKDTATGYAGPVTRRTGAAVAAGAKFFATPTQFEMRTQYGSVPISWADISPDSLIAMAKSYIKPDQPAEANAERQWRLGLVAIALGKADEGKELVEAAAAANPKFAEAKARVIDAEPQPQ